MTLDGFEEIKEVIFNQQHFGLNPFQPGYQYCDRENYVGLETPVEIYYSFDAVNALIMHKDISEKMVFDRDLVVSVFGSASELKEDLGYVDFNKKIKAKIKDFFLDIESIANVQFIESKNLQENHVNIVMQGVNQNSGLIKADKIAFTAHPTQKHYGALIYIRDPNDSNYINQVFGDIQHEILHGLCEDHPQFNSKKVEKINRSLVEDETTSHIMRSCQAEGEYVQAQQKCMGAENSGVKTNLFKFVRCVEAKVNASCLHKPTFLTPVDVSHLIYTFGISKKEQDPTNFRQKYIDKYSI